MPLDLHGFTAPVDQYGGLYQVASDMNKRNAERQAAKDKAAANQASMAKFLVDYTNPKDHLTGTLYDPIITKGYSDILQEGTKLIQSNPSLTTDMLLTALAPSVGKLSEYSEKAKTINDNIKLGLQGIGENSGYDKLKLEAAAKKKAFLDDNGQIKDLQTIDPSINYVTQTVKDNPFDVTNNKGIDEWLKNENRVINSTKVKHANDRGGYELKNVKTNAYSWAVPDVNDMGVNNRTFVPAFDEAIDNGKKLMHDFPNGSGGVVTAPVRMVQEPLFKRIMGNSPGTADWVRGQVLQHIKDYKDENGNPIDINSPQANNIARAILYDELKTRGLGGMEDIFETKPAQTKNITNVNMGSKKEDNTWIPPYLDDLKTNAKNNLVPLDATMSKALTKDGVSPDLLGIQNGQWKPIYFKRNKDGSILRQGDEENGTPIIDEMRSQPLTDNQMILLMGGQTGVKQKNLEMVKRPQGGSATKTKGKYD